jgi:hypothetical protein
MTAMEQRLHVPRVTDVLPVERKFGNRGAMSTENETLVDCRVDVLRGGCNLALLGDCNSLLGNGTVVYGLTNLWRGTDYRSD